MSKELWVSSLAPNDILTAPATYLPIPLLPAASRVKSFFFRILEILVSYLTAFVD